MRCHSRTEEKDETVGRKTFDRAIYEMSYSFINCFVVGGTTFYQRSLRPRWR
jgi:hypothetical protein